MGKHGGRFPYFYFSFFSFAAKRLYTIPLFRAYIRLFQNPSDKSNVYIALMWIGNNKSDIFFLHSTMFTARVRSIESKFLQIPD